MSYHIALIADNHFVFTESGQVYVNGTYTQQYLARFTSNFDKVTVVARGHKKGDDDIQKLRLSGGDRVEFCCLQDFIGVSEYIKYRKILKRHIKECLANVDAVFIRMPCILTTISLECAKELSLPTMIDVGADPESIYLSAQKSISISLISAYLKNVCKKSCMTANGVSYVTEKILQDKYPCRAIVYGEKTDYFTASISNVDISRDFFFFDRNYSKKRGNLQLLHISNNIPTNSGKGHYECLQVLRNLKDKGIEASIIFLGDGEGINELIAIADKLGIGDRVTFAGRVSDREEYRSYLIDSDIFLFPSHSEGLPRVLIEAMATGLVCVSSNVDGIPEILSKNDIFDYSDIEGMSSRIEYYVNNQTEMSITSEQNILIAKRYSDDKLKKRYDEFYQKVRTLIDIKRQ